MSGRRHGLRYESVIATLGVLVDADQLRAVFDGVRVMEHAALAVFNPPQT